MKRTLIISLIGIAALTIGMPACNQPKTDSLKQNPYPDNYAHVSALSQRHLWQAGNVHDPTIIKTDSFYYVYSTDAYYRQRGDNFFDIDQKIGNIPIRRSKDLVNWEFVGWALDTIPLEASRHVLSFEERGAVNVWAPHIQKHNDTYRIYYSVSSFGTNSSFIGLAESSSPEGPFIDKGCVVKTNPSDVMNAIDASVVTDAQTGEMWMHYGSYFGGLYCVQLNPETGLTQVDGDHGHLVATRANRRYKIIEAPEIIYHPELKQYYLFVSYEPLFTYYNVRVGRSDNPEGPFYDFFGNNMADTTNNYPILTHSYLFNNHPGWSGNGHCAVINDDGRFYMLHQGRLAPDNLMMVMHVRQMMFLPSGWPVVAPERYAGLQNKSLSEKELSGEWEIITLNDLEEQTTLEQGQIPPGGWTYKPEAFNRSVKLVINNDGTTSDKAFNRWSYDGNFLTLGETTCALFYGWDWENQEPTIQFSGILDNGSSIWGKKITNNLK